MKVSFTVLGEPTAKGRPRFARAGNYVRTYTPEKTVLYENLIKTEYRIQCGTKRFDDGATLKMSINAFFTIPKSTSKKKKEQMLTNEIRPTKKPDMDNITKVIADSLNDIAYRDDVQIVSARIEKYYSEQPRVEITIEDI